MILTKNYLKFFLFIIPLIDVPKIKTLSNVESLKELSFHDDLKINKL